MNVTVYEVWQGAVLHQRLSTRCPEDANFRTALLDAINETMNIADKLDANCGIVIKRTSREY